MTKHIAVTACTLLLAIILILVLPVPITDPGPEVRPTLPPATGSVPTVSVILPTTSTVPTTWPSLPTTFPTTFPTTIPTVPTTLPTTAPTTLPTIPTTIPTTPPTIATTIPTIPTTVPTEPPTVPTVPTEPSTTLPPRAGQVRLYVCDTGLLSSYVALSVEYFMATGIQVILMTPGPGESCAEGLARYMATDTPPTMFCLHRQETLEKYADYLYDLSDTDAAKQLYSPGFGMYNGGALLALPVAVDWFGFVYNAELLAHSATFSRTDFYRTDMSGYDSMVYIVKYLTSVKRYPFGKPDLTAAGLAPLLGTVFRNPEHLRSFVDLYIGNSSSVTDALGAFLSEKTVFYAGTTACFDEVLKLGIHKLDLLPAFVGDSDAMQYTCDTFWAVNATGYGPDVQETLAFLRWMVSPRGSNPAPVDSFGLLSPYKSATVSRNALEKLLRQYMAQEPARLTWAYPAVAPENMEAFCAALAAYYKTPNDATWAELKKYLP